MYGRSGEGAAGGQGTGSGAAPQLWSPSGGVLPDAGLAGPSQSTLPLSSSSLHSPRSGSTRRGAAVSVGDGAGGPGAPLHYGTLPLVAEGGLGLLGGGGGHSVDRDLLMAMMAEDDRQRREMAEGGSGDIAGLFAMAAAGGGSSGGGGGGMNQTLRPRAAVGSPPSLSSTQVLPPPPSALLPPHQQQSPQRHPATPPPANASADVHGSSAHAYVHKVSSIFQFSSDY